MTKQSQHQSLNIIYVSHLHPPRDAAIQNIGGMQTVSLQLLDSLNHRSDVRVYPLLLESPWQGIAVRTVGFLLKLFVTLPTTIQREQADLVLFSSMVSASLAPLIRSRVKIPMVTINHGQDVIIPVPLYQRWVPRVFHHLDGVISVSAATQLASLQRGLESSKSSVLPNGLVTRASPFDQGQSRVRLAETLNIDLEGKFLLLTVGRQIKRKGHAWFLQDVLPQIRQPVICMLVGHGPESEQLREIRARSPYADQIVLAGTVSSDLLLKAYAAADLFVMPNIPVDGDMEGFGVVILEANEAKTPVIATDLEGIKDVVHNGINGYRVPPLNAQAFAQKVDAVLTSELPTLSASAQAFVTQNYTWDVVGDRYVQVLRQIVAKRGWAGFVSRV